MGRRASSCRPCAASSRRRNPESEDHRPRWATGEVGRRPLPSARPRRVAHDPGRARRPRRVPGEAAGGPGRLRVLRRRGDRRRRDARLAGHRAGDQPDGRRAAALKGDGGPRTSRTKYSRRGRLRSGRPRCAGAPRRVGWRPTGRGHSHRPRTRTNAVNGASRATRGEGVGTSRAWRRSAAGLAIAVSAAMTASAVAADPPRSASPASPISTGT